MKKIIVLMMVSVVLVFAKDSEQLNSPEFSPEIIKTARASVRNKIKKFLLVIDQSKGKHVNYDRYDFSSNFISKVTATVGEKIILDISLNHYYYVLGRGRIYFKLNNRLPYADTIEYTLTNNHGDSIKKDVDVRAKLKYFDDKKTSKYLNAKRVKINPKAWNETSIDGAIKTLYGANALVEIKENKHKQYMKIKKCIFEGKCSHGVYAPMKIVVKSKSEFESIAIFSTTTEKALLAVIQGAKDDTTYIEIPFRIEKSGEIFTIVKTTDGKLYKSESYKFGVGRGDFSDMQIEFSFEK